jgi:hypothetical protein
MVAPNVCGSNLLCVTFQVLRILRRLLDFVKTCALLNCIIREVNELEYHNSMNQEDDVVLSTP